MAARNAGARALAVLLQTKRAEVPWRVLLRNTAAVIVPLALGIASGRVDIGLGIAVGAIVTMYSDQPGPYRQRLARLLAVSAAGGVAAFVGMLVGGRLSLLLPATLIIGFSGALLVVFGDAIARVGVAAMILLAITAAHPASGAAALQSAALIAGGGVLLTLFSIAAWPLQRYGPERQALAAVYHGLAILARQREVDAAAAPGLSEAMTALQHTLLGPLRARGAVMDSFGVLLELAERIRLELTALAGGDPGEPIARLVRHEAATLLDAIGGAVAGGTDPEQTMARALASLRAAESAPPSADSPGQHIPARHLQALCGQLAAAARNAGRASTLGEARAAREDLQLPRALRSRSAIATLSASLTPRSAAFRHAVRTAGCLAIGVWIGRLLAWSHGYWIPMTVAIVLRADYGATFSYGLLRVAGTVIGLSLTTALLHVLPAGPWAWLAVMAVLCAAFRYFGPVHYGVAVAALTGMVVLLLALAGEPAEPTMVSRLTATVIGSAMALAAYGLWPTREREQIRTALTRLLEAYAAYVAALGASVRPAARREARQAVRVARANAEAAQARLLAEPNTPAMLAELAHSLLANSNRLARTTMTLDAVLGEPAALPAMQALDPVTDRCAGSLRSIAASIGGTPVVPPGELRGLQRECARRLGADGGPLAAELVALTDRLVDNINTLAHVVARAQSVAVI
jgi:uncharacterized membrane protein YccC